MTNMLLLGVTLLACSLSALANVNTAHREPVGNVVPSLSLEQPFLGKRLAFLDNTRQNSSANSSLIRHCAPTIPTDESMNIPNWDFYGSTIVTEDYVRLTPDRQSKRGSLWSNRVSVNLHLGCFFLYFVAH